MRSWVVVPIRVLAAAAAVVSGCGFDLAPAGSVVGDAGPDSDGNIVDSSDDPDAAEDAPSCTWGPWGVPQPIVELNSGTIDARPRLTSDELTVIFYSTRNGGAGDRDLYMAQRSSLASAFSTPVNITELNTASSDRDPAWSGDGLIVVFSSTRAGGEYDLWIATRSAQTAFSTPQPISLLNTTAREYFTNLSADGLTIYFSSNRVTGSVGGYDVWFSTRASTSAPFTTVQNLAAINTSAHEYQALVSPDGREIYFSSSRSGSVEIYVSTRADTASPFGTATPVAELSFVGEEYPGWMSGDGRRLYYSHAGTGIPQLYVAARNCL